MPDVHFSVDLAPVDQGQQNSPPLQDPIVLVVDDQRAIRILLKRALEKHGFEVWMASGGFEAMEIYGRNPGAIAAVLIDVCMPEMDGPQTLNAIRELNPDVAGCFMTADHRLIESELFPPAYVSRVIKKPFDLDEVIRMTRQLVLEAERAATAHDGRA
jgi:DNA-binding NtrC family response regulator